MIAYIALFSAFLSRLIALACGSTRVTSFIARFFFFFLNKYPPKWCTYSAGSFTCYCGNTGGGTDTEIRVSTESRPWRREFSRRACRDSNTRPFSHESGALTTELSPPQEGPPAAFLPETGKDIQSQSFILTQFYRAVIESVPDIFHHCLVQQRVSKG